MYLYINNEIGIFTDKIVGVFDMDNTTQGSKITSHFLRENENTDATDGNIPRSFIVTSDNRVIITAYNTQTLIKRCI